MFIMLFGEIISAVFCLITPIAVCYPSFQSKIPNGNRVPHPCRDEIWRGVGHYNKDGGGARNPFGTDFENAGMVWTTSLCHGDSDMDGYTNGEELGDPYCIWTEGATPSRTTGISHPGICDPYNSPQCLPKNDLFSFACSETSLNCSALQSPSTFNITYKLPSTLVPTTETSLRCIIFNFPQHKDYHLIGYEAFVDNRKVLHHAALYGVFDKVPSTEVNIVFDCSEMSRRMQLIGAWTYGQSGHCLHVDTGIKVGLNSFTQGAIQLHWYNEDKVPNLFDGSGLTLYLTPNLRPYDAGILLVGEPNINIPPGMARHEKVFECPAACTSYLVNGTVKIFAASNHMHVLGRSMSLELHRNNYKIADIAYDPLYDYNMPVIRQYSTTIEMLRGDKIVTKCVYDSTSRTNTTVFGFRQTDEMCFGLIYYYPISSLQMSYCFGLSCLAKIENFNGCNKWKEFNYGWNAEHRVVIDGIMNNCEAFGECTTDCSNAQMSFRENKCITGIAYDLITDRLKNQQYFDEQAHMFHNKLRTCGYCFRLYNLTITENKQLYDSVVNSCQLYGPCLPQCKQVILNLETNPCFQGSSYRRFRQYAIENNDHAWVAFHACVASCKTY